MKAPKAEQVTVSQEEIIEEFSTTRRYLPGDIWEGDPAEGVWQLDTGGYWYDVTPIDQQQEDPVEVLPVVSPIQSPPGIPQAASSSTSLPQPAASPVSSPGPAPATGDTRAGDATGSALPAASSPGNTPDVTLRIREADSVKLPLVPTVAGLKRWKLAASRAVVTASARTGDAQMRVLKWFSEVENYEIPSASLGKSTEFDTLDSKLAHCL